MGEVVMEPDWMDLCYEASELYAGLVKAVDRCPAGLVPAETATLIELLDEWCRSVESDQHSLSVIPEPCGKEIQNDRTS